MLFDRFRKAKKNPAMVAPAELINGNPAFSAWGGSAWQNDIYRSGVDAIARHAAKLKGAYIIQSGEIRTPANDRLNRILQISPNPYMNAYDFLYKVVTHLFLYNNSFVFLQRDNGTVAGIYPLNPQRVEFMTDATGEMFVKFYFDKGKTVVLPYADIVHLRRNFNANDMLGDDNAALEPALELADTQNNGIINGIKSSANIRGILRYTQIMAPETLKRERDAFVADYLSINNSGGVVVTDSKSEYTPLEIKPATIDAEQIGAAAAKIYNYLGISDKIVNATYSENEFGAFAESVIEPIALQLGLEFTRKVFTEREIAFGNQIVFDGSRLQFSSNATKVNTIKELVPYGLLTINQALAILNLPAVEDGDKRLQALNMIDAANAAAYQTGANGE